MKLKAIVTINYSHKLMEAGKVFECADEDATALLAVGAAEVVATKEKAPADKDK